MHKTLENLTARLLAGAILLFSSTAINAATSLSLQLQPSSSLVGIGTSFTLDLLISGLGEHAVPSLSAFDVDLSYDDDIFTLDRIDFGTALGSSGDVHAGSDTAIPGSANIWELSELPTPELEGLQASSLTLATITFTAIKSGTGSFGLTLNALGDGFGDPLDADPGSAPSVSVVPIPAAVWLFGTAMAGLGVFGCGRRKSVLS